MADSDRLLQWRNEAEVRAASRSSAKIAASEHVAWFARRLGDPDSRIFIVERDGRPAGQVRVDRIDAARGEIHVALAREHRGSGLAAPTLALAARRGSHELALEVVEANVRADNERSLRAFARAGFAEIRRGGGWVLLEWTAG